MVWRRWSWSNLQWEIAGFERLEISAGVTQTADNHLENLLAGNNSPPSPPPPDEKGGITFERDMQRLVRMSTLDVSKN